VLDPTGVVKGWAAERAADHLRALDSTDFCLSAGGDLVCRTLEPGAAPWRIGIEHPHDPSRLVAVVPVAIGAVATSGTRTVATTWSTPAAAGHRPGSPR
jgi:FAD:protein FMN transferase